MEPVNEDMETEEELDYSEDLQTAQIFPDRPIFAPPPEAPVSLFSGSHPTPSVSIPVPPPLERLKALSQPYHLAWISPPLSPGTLRFLSSVIPPSPPFESRPPSTSFPALPSTSQAPPSSSGFSAHLNSPSGCFETPAVKVDTSRENPPDSLPDPLIHHPSAPRSGKKRTKCVKSTSKDIAIWFSEATTIAETEVMANTILVGRV